MREVCRIIGVLDNGVAGLTPQALDILKQAEVVIGATRVLQLFVNEISPQAMQHDLTRQLMQVPDWIRDSLASNKRTVVLATGDPSCHGIAKFIIGKIGRAHCDVVPNVSTVQLACARLGLSWQDMKICSIHSRDAGEWIEGADPSHGLYKLLQAITQHKTVVVLTSPKNTPARIAHMLQLEGRGEQFVISVVSNILQADEVVSAELSIDSAAQQMFADPNVVIVQASNETDHAIMFGLDDASFQQRKPDKGLITKREVRAVSLASMQLRRDSIVWDIGAGSGAVGLEVARLCVDGHVYAIEKNVADVANALANKRQLQVSNYTLLHAKAPTGLDGWSDPDAIFIGGSGGELSNLIELAMQRLCPQGRLVMNFVTFENLSTATETLKRLQVVWSLNQLNVSRSQPILNMQRLAAENPIWIVTAQKGEANVN